MPGRVIRSELAWAASVFAAAALLSIAQGDWSWMDFATGYAIVRGMLLAVRWLPRL